MTTGSDVTLSFFATHAVTTLVNPVLELTYESGRVVWEQDGRTRVYRGGALAEELGDDGVVSRDEMFRNVLAAAKGEGKPRSSIDNAWQHVACVEALFESSPVAAIPARHVNVVESEEPAGRATQAVIVGIEEVLAQMFREGKSFAEVGAPWAVKGRVVRLP